MSNSPAAGKPTKKLIQPCLPFKLVESPGDDVNTKCRKRKLSGTENDESRVENPKVELINGGTKCFIKSDNEPKQNLEVQEICEEDVNNKNGAKESINLVISSSEKSIEKFDKETNVNTSTVNENMDIDGSVSNSSDSDIVLIDTSVNSTSDGGQLENTTPSSKKHTSRPKLKNLESAKKQEERLRLKQEKEKAREEKLKEQAEKQRLKQLEKEQKRLAEIEAKRLRELEKEREKKQKEDEKKAKELEKERERKQREEEKKAKELEKEKEKRQKEDERKAKEFEKEKQREEKLVREEMEKKKKEKEKAAFVGFFKQKSVNLDTSKKDEEIMEPQKETYFMPFQTKQDMRIAPFCRSFLNSDRKKFIDKCISKSEQNEDFLYLNLLKTKKHEPSKSEATWPVHVEDDSDVIIIETGLANEEGDFNKIDTNLKSNAHNYCWKLLQFNENKRPPYWGTWRKKSLYIKPRRPFAIDKVMFDYEIDSDDEWEEEDPGESIHGTDNEEEPEDDYDIDNDVFVPHGYLSDEEGQDNDNDVSAEVQKEKLKLLGEEFEAEIKKKTERIKPRLVGCIWIPNNVTNPENVSKTVADTLLKYRCIWEDEEPIITEAPVIVDSPKDVIVSENKKTLLPDSIIPDLITFLHGNSNGIKVAAKNFINKLVENGQNIDDNSISLSSVRRTIRTIATKSTNVKPWYVNKENFEKYGVEYPQNMENEVLKPIKTSITKITNFMTQCQKANTTLLEKSLETDQNMTEPVKISFIPKNLFNNKEGLKPPVKEEQKVNIVGGKKRITPILLSPKKNLKSKADGMSKKRSLSPEIEIVCDGTSIPNPNDIIV